MKNKEKQRKKQKKQKQRNKQQKKDAELNKKKVLIEMKTFFYKKERENIGWWFLLGY